MMATVSEVFGRYVVEVNISDGLKNGDGWLRCGWIYLGFIWQEKRLKIGSGGG